jgi:alpha-N-arabinofuranosidase
VFPGPPADTAARLAILFNGPGSLVVDSVSLFPADNVRRGAGMMNPWPFRADLLGALKALKPA